MDQYTPHEFRQLYGRLNNCIFWGNVESVIKQNDMVTLVCANNYSITLPIMFHEGTWKPHGIAYSPKGEKHYRFGKSHREDGPASIIRYTNGNIQIESYYWEGKWHRENGPAVCAWHENGNVNMIMYHHHGRKHRVGGPRCQTFDKTGWLIMEDWYVDGKLHRIGGPASIYWDKRNNKYDEYWYVNGEKILPLNYIDDMFEAPARWSDQEFD